MPSPLRPLELLLPVRGERAWAMIGLLFFSIPAWHISARWSSHALQSAVNAADFARAQVLWQRMTWLFVAAFIVLTIAAAIARVKPRLGQSE